MTKKHETGAVGVPTIGAAARPAQRPACGRRALLGRTVALGAAALAASMLPPAAGTARAATPADWDKVIAAAKKEGKVVVYASTFGSAQYKAITKAFESKYGISVETLDIRASEMYERIRVEQSANRFIADLVLQPVSVVTVIERAGLLQKHRGMPNAKNLRPDIVASLAGNEYRIPIWSQLYGILVNGSVPLAEEPKAWRDLLDPKWKGKLILDDPRAIGNGFSLFNATYKGIGPEFQAKLAANAPVVSRQVRNDERRVARGELPLYAPHNFTFFREMQGLPVRFVFPSEGSPNADTQAVFAKNLPHPNAAHLFVNHVLDAESQVILGNSGLMPTVTGVVDKLDTEVKRMFAVKRLPQVNVDEMNEIMGKAKELYK